jgi:hypothetical protein
MDINYELYNYEEVMHCYGLSPIKFGKSQHQTSEIQSCSSRILHSCEILPSMVGRINKPLVF